MSAGRQLVFANVVACRVCFILRRLQYLRERRRQLIVPARFPCLGLCDR